MPRKRKPKNENGGKLEDFVTWILKKQGKPNVQHDVTITTKYDPRGNQIDVLFGRNGSKILVECKYKSAKVGRKEVSDTFAKVSSLYKARKSNGLFSRNSVPNIQHVLMISNNDYVDRAHIYLGDVIQSELKKIDIKSFSLYNGFDLEGEYYRALGGRKGRTLKKLWKNIKPLRDKIQKLHIEELQYKIKNKNTLFKERYRKKLKEYKQEINKLKNEVQPYKTEFANYKKKKRIHDINYLIQHRR